MRAAWLPLASAAFAAAIDASIVDCVVVSNWLMTAPVSAMCCSLLGFDRCGGKRNRGHELGVLAILIGAHLRDRRQIALPLQQAGKFAFGRAAHVRRRTGKVSCNRLLPI